MTSAAVRMDAALEARSALAPPTEDAARSEPASGGGRSRAPTRAEERPRRTTFSARGLCGRFNCSARLRARFERSRGRRESCLRGARPTLDAWHARYSGRGAASVAVQTVPEAKSARHLNASGRSSGGLGSIAWTASSGPESKWGRVRLDCSSWFTSSHASEVPANYCRRHFR